MCWRPSAELADPAMDAAPEAEPGYGVVGVSDQLGADVKRARIKADQPVLRVEAQADERRIRVSWRWPYHGSGTRLDQSGAPRVPRPVAQRPRPGLAYGTCQH